MTHSRRDFLADVGKGMIAAGLGSGLAFELGLCPAIAGDEPPACPGNVLSMPMRRDRGGIAEAVRRLDDAGVGIEDIALRRPTLDDVFMSLTGHAAEEERADEEREEAYA